MQRFLRLCMQQDFQVYEKRKLKQLAPQCVVVTSSPYVVFSVASVQASQFIGH